ncbi:MAG: hypothetical protein ACI87A_000194 [Planctomycetota bacterium]|jgi:hypothetical protein
MVGRKCRVGAAVRELLKRQGLELPGREAIGRESSGCAVQVMRGDVGEELQGY